MRKVLSETRIDFPDLRDVERLVRALLQRLPKAAHNDRVLSLRQTGLAMFAGSEAVDQSIDQRLL